MTQNSLFNTNHCNVIYIYEPIWINKIMAYLLGILLYYIKKHLEFMSQINIQLMFILLLYIYNKILHFQYFMTYTIII